MRSFSALARSAGKAQDGGAVQRLPQRCKLYITDAQAARVAEAARMLLLEGKSNHITVLLRLREAGEASLSDIQRWLAGGRYRAQYNWTLSIVSELKEAGLVEERVVQAGKLKVRLYRLTEKGREAAELLAKLFA
jgi:DNA-binding HxlR family transcriptional regulator